MSYDVRKLKNKATNEQISVLRKIIAQRPDMLTNTLNPNYDNDWKSLVLMLNNLGNAKTTEQWKRSWKDQEKQVYAQKHISMITSNECGENALMHPPSARSITEQSANTAAVSFSSNGLLSSTSCFSRTPTAPSTVAFSGLKRFASGAAVSSPSNKLLASTISDANPIFQCSTALNINHKVAASESVASSDFGYESADTQHSNMSEPITIAKNHNSSSNNSTFILVEVPSSVEGDLPTFNSSENVPSTEEDTCKAVKCEIDSWNFPDALPRWIQPMVKKVKKETASCIKDEESTDEDDLVCLGYSLNPNSALVSTLKNNTSDNQSKETHRTTVERPTNTNRVNNSEAFSPPARINSKRSSLSENSAAAVTAMQDHNNVISQLSQSVNQLSTKISEMQRHNKDLFQQLSQSVTQLSLNIEVANNNNEKFHQEVLAVLREISRDFKELIKKF